MRRAPDTSGPAGLISLWIWRILALALLVAGVPATRANPNGINTPSDLIAYLRRISGTHTLSGQYVETGDMAPIRAIHDATGKWLGIVSGDYYHYDHKGPAVTSFNAGAIEYWKAGGLVELNLHMPNPSTGGPRVRSRRARCGGPPHAGHPHP